MCGQDRPERMPPQQLGPYRAGSCLVGRTPTNASSPVGPVSTPRNRLTGSATVGSGRSMVAYRNHLPSRHIRSVSPIARARASTRSLGIARSCAAVRLPAQPAIRVIGTVADAYATLARTSRPAIEVRIRVEATLRALAQGQSAAVAFCDSTECASTARWTCGVLQNLRNRCLSENSDVARYLLRSRYSGRPCPRIDSILCPAH